MTARSYFCRRNLDTLREYISGREISVFANIPFENFVREAQRV
jgi:hypothetical protein